MKRRLVILLAVIVMATGVPLGAARTIDRITVDPLGLFFDSEEALTFRGAITIAKTLDQLGDMLEMPPLPHDGKGMIMLTGEIVPYYYYDRIVEGKAQYLAPQWSVFEGDGYFHVAGRCRVGNNPIVWINVRFANPYSSWYGRAGMFSVLVHELAHSQGIFRMGDPMSEPATQLATVEVLAAMARDQNVWAVPAFIREVQGYAHDYAFSRALQEDRMEEFEAYLSTVHADVYGFAKYKRAMDHWADDMPELRRILKHYGEQPYILLVKALNDPAYQSVELLALPNETHRLTVNDAAWVLQNLYALVRDYPGLLERFALQSRT